MRYASSAAPMMFLAFPVSRKITYPTPSFTRSQFRDIWNGEGHSPERELASAVLDAAASDLRNYRYARRRRRQRIYWQTYQWVASDSREWPFSFVNMCEFLRISRRRCASNCSLHPTANARWPKPRSPRTPLRRARCERSCVGARHAVPLR